MVNIAILDTGVSVEFQSQLSGFSVCNNEISENFEDNYGHGTAVWGIIRTVNDFANIYMIKIGENDEINEEDLVFALEYIYENMSIDIINISCGTNILRLGNKLHDICKKLSNKGVILVAAFDNAGAISFPAAFDCVIGVTTGTHCIKATDFEYIGGPTVDIAAKGNVQRLLWKNPKYIFLGGDSFACAHVTVQIAKYYCSGIHSKEQLIKSFKLNSRHQNSTKVMEKQFHIPTIPFSIQRAALYPFSKEMHSLIRFSDMLPFSIAGVYTSRYSGLSHLRVDALLEGCKGKDIIIKATDDVQWDSFDTLIVGHLDLLNSAAPSDSQFLNEAIKKNINIYAFDDRYLPFKCSEKFFCPAINESSLPGYDAGKLYRIGAPVLGVFGTSSAQGKFTLQMELRRVLLKLGYKVGQIGSEPSSLLYQIDCVFPMGYNSTVTLSPESTIRYLNYLLYYLSEEKKSEIIIVGSQSGTIPFDKGNLMYYTTPQYLFLEGTQPDAIILCTNPYDDISYIKRTIQFVESAEDCKVLAEVVFPMDYNNSWSSLYGGKKRLDYEQFELIKEKHEEELRIPCYLLGIEDHYKHIVETVIDYFS